jgi:hypothetical protein
MLKTLCLAAGLVASVLFAGCSATQPTNVNQTLANLNQTNLIALQTIKSGCSIVQPTLTAAAVASPQIASAAAVNGVVCATASVAADAASAVVAAQAAQAASAVAASTPLAGAPLQ